MSAGDAARTDGPTARSAGIALVVSIVLCGGFHLGFGTHNLNLRDEGYLWYGVVGVLAGEVPFRDFQAYDPGRYYWCAAFSWLFGDGLIGLRASLATFGALGMFCGLLVVRRVLRHDAWLPFAGLLLLLWMFPRHKLFEHAIPLIALWSAVRLLEDPTARRHLAFGVIAGAAAFLGRNHGLYLVIAAALLTLVLHTRADRKPSLQATLAGAGGILLGYAPMLWMLGFVQDFASAFQTAVFSVVQQGVNHPAPYRWPWTPSQEGWAGDLALDLAFALPLIAIPLGLFLSLKGKGALRERAPLVASSLIALVYVPHYYVRSDLPHLAQAYGPVLLTALAIAAACGARARAQAIFLAVLLLIATGVAGEGHAELKDLAPGAQTPERVAVSIHGEELLLKNLQAVIVRRVRRVIERRVGEDQLFIASSMPMWYPLLDKRSPVWWIHFIWPATDEEQQATIRTLREQEVNWALIIEKAFTGLPEYDLDQTNPMIMDHFASEWTEVSDPQLPPAYTLFRRDLP